MTPPIRLRGPGRRNGSQKPYRLGDRLFAWLYQVHPDFGIYAGGRPASVHFNPKCKLAKSNGVYVGNHPVSGGVV